jgi:hypothetical protein
MSLTSLHIQEIAVLYQRNANAVYGTGVREILVKLIPIPSSAGGREMSEAGDQSMGDGDSSLNNGQTFIAPSRWAAGVYLSFMS